MYPVIAQALNLLALFAVAVVGLVYLARDVNPTLQEFRSRRFLVLAGSSFFFALLAAIFAVLSLLRQENASTSVILGVVVFVSFAMGIFALTALPIIALDTRERFPRLGLFLSYLVAMFTWNILFAIAMEALNVETQEEFAFRDVSADAPIQLLAVLFVALLAAIFEEIIYRGALQPLLGKLLRSRMLGLVVTSLLFGIAHSAYITPHGLKELHTFGLGMLFGYARIRYGLLSAVALHGLNNGISVLAVFFLPDDGLSTLGL